MYRPRTRSFTVCLPLDGPESEVDCQAFVQIEKGTPGYGDRGTPSEVVLIELIRNLDGRVVPESLAERFHQKLEAQVFGQIETHRPSPGDYGV